MKIDFNQVIKDQFDRPIMDGGQCRACGHTNEEKPLTLATVAARALNVNGPDERLNFEEVVKRGNLAIVIGAGGELEISLEEVVLIRNNLRFVYTNVVVARAATMLDGKVK